MDTYSNDGRVIWHWGRFLLLRLCILLNAQILHIAATEDDVFVDLVRAGLFLRGIAAAAFGAVGGDILEGNGGVFAVDFVQGADVFDVGL